MTWDMLQAGIFKLGELIDYSQSYLPYKGPFSDHSREHSCSQTDLVFFTEPHDT